MESFESAFLDELDYLTELAKYHAEDSPHLTDFLPDSGDPDVARLAEGFACLTARLRQTITDDFPEITQNILSRVWPLPLRPMPSTSIIQFFPKDTRIDNPLDIPAHSQVFAEHNNRTVTFQTCHALHIEPVRLLRRTLTRSNDRSQLTLTFCYDGKRENWQVGVLRFFLSEDKTIATTLMLWLEQYLTETTIHYATDPIRIDPVLTTWEPSADTLILPVNKPDFWPLQLLPELFYLPHVHDFISLDLSNEFTTLPFSQGQQFDITFVFDGVIPLTTVENAFMLHCVPAINLYNTQTAAIPFQQDYAGYTLALPDALFDINSVDSLQEPESEPGEQYTFLPINENHVTAHRFSEQRQKTFFYAMKRRRDPLDREQFQLMFYHYNGQPMTDCHLEAFVCHYTAFDKQAELLARGMITLPGENIQSELAVTNITPVSPHYPMMKTTLWSSLSLLMFGPFCFNDIDAVKALIGQFDCYPERSAPLSRQIQRYIEGLVSITSQPVDRLHQGRPFRGIGITLTMDESCYASTGAMYQFALALNSLFSVSQTENSFILMDIIRLPSQERWSFAQLNGHRKIM